MNLNFNDDYLYTICIYQDKKLPLNFAIRGVQQVCEQVYIREKDMQCDMLYSPVNKRR